MPDFSGQGQGDIGIIPIQDQNHMRQIADYNRKRNSLNVPRQPVYITKASKENQVFVYNVGPWTYTQSAASMGEFFIPGLDEADCLGSDLKVSAPLIIPGLPSEPYPAEGSRAIVNYHTPLETMPNADKAGLHFALELIGAGAMQNNEANLSLRGVFVSEQPEQKQPAKGGQWDAYNKWAKAVRDAQDRLRKYCVGQCQKASDAKANGQFAIMREERLYQCARLIKATPVEYPWLGDSQESAMRQSCPACGSVVKSSIFICPHCKEVIDAVGLAEMRKKRDALVGSAA